ncbi:MAG: ABC transporter ATP-binding protein/permease [Ruminococcus sp.]|jgi:ATP-binding cassette subfamily B protein|nr:ABC transporter ATP-binding protein/permease [Ruminococcus sp.]
MFQLKWIWSNLKGYRGLYIFAAVLSVIGHVLYLTSPIFGQQIVDTFIESPDAKTAIVEQRELFFWLCAGMVGFTLIRAIIQFSASMLYERSSQAMMYRIRTYLFANVQRQDMSYYDSNRTGDLMTRLSGDLDHVRHTVAWVGKTFVESMVLFISTSVYFFYLDPFLALSMLLLTPIIFVTSNIFRKRVGPMYTSLRETLSQLNIRAQENIAGNRVVKAFAREDFEVEKFQEKSTEYADASKKTALTWWKFFPFIETTAQGLAVIHLLVGGIFVMIGRLTFGEYIAFSGLIWTLSNPMRFIGNLVNDFQRFMASAAKIIEVYYSRPMIVDRVDAEKTEGKLEGKIEFRDVTFHYRRSNTAALKNISFTVSPGETVAIMGETGAGKTTLINMIPRFYDPEAGEILVDDVNVRFHKLQNLRKNIGIAMQDVILWSDTIDGNIAFGDTDLPEEEVKRFALLADADGFIEKTPEGYETIIGERGVGLSGGQKQRISLARALAVKPAILILDDTTSAVDLETEQVIQDNLNNKLGYKPTRLIIAQRVSTARVADRIIIIKDGEISESGTHEELLKIENGYYKEIHDLQIGQVA